MFQFLRRVVIAGLIGCVLTGVYWFVQQTRLHASVGDVIAAWRNRGEREQVFVGELKGEVTRVLEGDSFELRADDKRLYRCGLTGLMAPKLAAARTAEEKQQAQESRAALSRLVLSNRVDLKLTYQTEFRSVLAVAYLNETNLNAHMVASGAARLEPSFIKGLPIREQYPFFRAARRAAETKASPAVGGVH